MILSLGITPKNYAVSGGASYDADAQAYFTANTSITSDADKTAINTFYLGLKSDGIYTKLSAMYLPLWSSASANKWNLVNPVDSNPAYRLTFSTGWTHASSGMTPTNAYADTFIAGTTFSTNVHLSYYCGTQTASAQAEMGSVSASSNLSIRVGSLAVLGGTTSISYTTTTDKRGWWLASKRSNSDRELYRNGVSEATLTTLITNAFSANNIWIGGNNNGGSIQFASSKQCRFSSIGLGLTDTEASNFSNRLNTLMTYFGLNTY
jgi:hypothetical protein